jgi:hypothetical protein
MSSADKEASPPFAIFRARDAFEGGQSVTREPHGPVATEGYEALTEAGLLDGCMLRTLYSSPECSLVYAWFKSGFPLPRHSHDSDCLYFIVAGSLKLGNEELGPGSGFFVGANVPYTYVAGEQGVEVLEFRATNDYDIKLLSENPAWWANALQNLARARQDWPDQPAPPSGIEWS